MPTCHTCKFYEILTGECRRNAPQSVTLILVDAGDTVNTRAVWPSVKRDDWCGEWAGKPGNEFRGPDIWTVDNAVPNMP